METGEIRIKTLLAAIAAILGVELLVGRIAPENLSGRLSVLGLGRLLETFFLLGIVGIWGGGLKAIGLSSSKAVEGIRKGVIWSMGFGAAAMTCGWVIHLFGINPFSFTASALPKNMNELVLFFLVGGIVGPVAEEVFFRGVCYGFFRKWGIAAALILTTAVFVSAHLLRSGIPLTQIIGGVVFALAYEKEKNLLVPIVIHISGNLAIFALSIALN